MHFDVPGSIESYYQGSLPGGRDGYPCRGLLLFNYADTRTQEFFIEGSNPPRQVIESIYNKIWEMLRTARPRELPVREFAESLDLKTTCRCRPPSSSWNVTGLSNGKSGENPARIRQTARATPAAGGMTPKTNLMRMLEKFTPRIFRRASAF